MVGAFEVSSGICLMGSMVQYALLGVTSYCGLAALVNTFGSANRPSVSLVANSVSGIWVCLSGYLSVVSSWSLGRAVMYNIDSIGSRGTVRSLVEGRSGQGCYLNSVSQLSSEKGIIMASRVESGLRLGILECIEVLDGLGGVAGILGTCTLNVINSGIALRVHIIGIGSILVIESVSSVKGTCVLNVITYISGIVGITDL